ncbi:WXG100 family type VII secretion target [Microbacterium sp.]|uniref:WXG100 family type VII secretion target n=1 Tax=Microbacterium sp. TaxID=51671 RepID=UPI003F9E0C2E
MSVNPEQVTVLAGQIRTGAKGIKEQLENLDTAVTKLRGAWSGEAQTSYDQAQIKWNKSLSEMQELLAQISTKTEEIAGSYLQTDKGSSRRFLIN